MSQLMTHSISAPCINGPTDNNGEIQSVGHCKVYFSSNTKVEGRWLRSTGLLGHV